MRGNIRSWNDTNKHFQNANSYPALYFLCLKNLFLINSMVFDEFNHVFVPIGSLSFYYCRTSWNIKIKMELYLYYMVAFYEYLTKKFRLLI